MTSFYYVIVSIVAYKAYGPYDSIKMYLSQCRDCITRSLHSIRPCQHLLKFSFAMKVFRTENSADPEEQFISNKLYIFI